MQFIRATSTAAAALFLLFGMIVPAYAQHDKQNENQVKPERHEGGQQQAAPQAVQQQRSPGQTFCSTPPEMPPLLMIPRPVSTPSLLLLSKRFREMTAAFVLLAFASEMPEVLLRMTLLSTSVPDTFGLITMPEPSAPGELLSRTVKPSIVTSSAQTTKEDERR